MRLPTRAIALVGWVFIAASAVLAVDPPPDEGFGVLCMYAYFDEENGPQDGEVSYPEYFMFTPMDLYTVLYHPRGETQTLLSFEYTVLIRQQGET
jgi:hypothetical protein